QAFLIEMSMLPIHAPSIRTCATRLPPASATAIFIGCPISAAFFSAAAITRLASSSVTIINPPLHRGRLVLFLQRNSQDTTNDVLDISPDKLKTEKWKLTI